MIPFSIPERESDQPFRLEELAYMLLSVLRKSGDPHFVSMHDSPEQQAADYGMLRVDLWSAGWDASPTDVRDAVAWAQRTLQIEKLGQVPYAKARD